MEIDEKLKEELRRCFETTGSKAKQRDKLDLENLGRIIHFHQLIESIVLEIAIKESGNPNIHKFVEGHKNRINFISSYKNYEHVKIIKNTLTTLLEIRNNFAHSLDNEKFETKLNKMKEISGINNDKDFSKLNPFEKYSLVVLIYVHYLNFIKINVEHTELKEKSFQEEEKKLLNYIREIYKSENKK